MIRLFSIKMNVSLVLLALFAGFVLTTLGELWWEFTQPQPIDIASVSYQNLSNGTRVLRVINRAPAKSSCFRITEHLLYRDDELRAAGGLPPRVYVPLSNTITGLGFHGVVDYTVDLTIPDGTAPVEWQFTTRSIYLCTVFPGLMSVIQRSTNPYTVDLSDAKHDG